MAIKKKAVGKGIFAEERTNYSGKDIQTGFIEVLGNWARDYEKGGGNFGAVTYRWVEASKRILDEFSEQFPERDTIPWFAQQIIRHHEIAVAEKERGEFDSAMRFAFDLGEIVERLRMKCQWEEYALQGKREALVSSQGGKSSAARHFQKTQHILLQMKNLVAKGHTISNAANLVFRNGCGASKDANRKLWQRHSRKLGLDKRCPD